MDVIDWDEIGELQLAFLRAGVSHQDTPQDHAFFATLHKYTERYKIKLYLVAVIYQQGSHRPNKMDVLHF